VKRIVALSDTHGKHELISVPKCDLLIIAGDLEITGLLSLHVFNEWLGKLDARHKIICAGNHDSYLEFIGKEECKKQFINGIYLENETVEIEGLKIFGSPFSCMFNNWAFMRYDSDLKEIWEKILLDTDIVVCHTMPYGILDQVLPREESVGSVFLRDRIKIVKPKIFLGGHLHLCGGQKYTDYVTDYYNVSIMDDMYQVINKPTIIKI